MGTFSSLWTLKGMAIFSSLISVNLHCKPEGSLGHKVYHKPKYINLYLSTNSHHNSSKKQALLSMLVHGNRSLCDWESLHSKLEFLKTIFRQTAAATNRSDGLSKCWGVSHCP
jgi:hypothetical protein